MLVFDCFGVLYGGSLFSLLALCPPEKRQQLIDLNKQNDYGFLEFSEYTNRMADLLQMTPAEVSAIFRQKRVRNQPLFDYIATVKSPEVKIVLLTNAGKDMPGVLFTDDELNGGVFDEVVVSSSLGLVKPNPAVFTLVAERCGVDTSDCLMIDDTFENGNGAEAVGMQAVWFADNATAIQQVERFLQRSNN